MRVVSREPQMFGDGSSGADALEVHVLGWANRSSGPLTKKYGALFTLARDVVILSTRCYSCPLGFIVLRWPFLPSSRSASLPVWRWFWPRRAPSMRRSGNWRFAPGSASWRWRRSWRSRNWCWSGCVPTLLRRAGHSSTAGLRQARRVCFSFRGIGFLGMLREKALPGADAGAFTAYLFHGFPTSYRGVSAGRPGPRICVLRSAFARGAGGLAGGCSRDRPR